MIKHKMQGLILAFFVLSLSISAQPAKTARVTVNNGKPTLFVDNQPVSPHFYSLTHAYGGRWSWEEVPQRNLKLFCEQGIRLYQLDLYFEDIWYKNADTLDIAKARKQVRGLLEVCPDASVVIRVHVNAPFWWNEANPDERVEFANGPVDNRPYGPPYNNEDGDTDRPFRASLASLKWRHESGNKLIEFCRRMADTPEGKSVIGIHVSGGVYGEWHNWGFIANDPDVGKPMTNYFRNWLRNKYKTNAALQKAWKNTKYTLDNATVPDTSERNFTSDGIFRDPQKEQRTIDYFTAQQEVVAEDIEYFTKLVKDTWPRPCIVGVFYGYFHMTFCRQAAGGHLFIERILNCPTIDYLSAPQSYWSDAQLAGGSGNSRGVIESGLLHGKLWLDEVDNGHIQKATTIDPVRNTGKYDPTYIPVIRRSALYPLMRGIGMWYYDFGTRASFGWWDNPVYLKNIKEEKALFDKKVSEPYQPVADVLIVWDQESFYHVKNGWTPICYNMIDDAFEQVLRAGASTDQIYLFDLDRANLKRYKAILFMNVFKITDNQRKFIREKVATDGRTVIWNYLPGYTNGTVNSFEFVKEVTGFDITPITLNQTPAVNIPSLQVNYEFQSPVMPLAVITDKKAETLGTLTGRSDVVIAKKQGKNHTAIFATLPLHDSNLFRNLFRTAGCHIYNEANDFTYANSGLIMLHTKDGGKRTLHLKNGTLLELSIPPYSTLLFDAQTGKEVLK